MVKNMKSLRRIGKLFSMGAAGVATLFALNGDIKDKRGLENILGTNAEATTVTVDKGVSNPPTTYPGLNAALNATADGDTIFVKYAHQAGDETIADAYCEEVIMNETTGKRVWRGETGRYLFPVVCPAPGTFNQFIFKGTNVDMDVQFFTFYGLERVNDRYLSGGLVAVDTNPLLDYTSNIRENILLGFLGSAIYNKKYVFGIERNSILSIGGPNYAITIDNGSIVSGSVISKNTLYPNRRADLSLVPLSGKIGRIQRLPLAFDTNLSGGMAIDDTTVIVRDNIIQNTVSGKITGAMLPMDVAPMVNISAPDSMLISRNYWHKGSVLTPTQVNADPSVLAGPHYPVSATLVNTVPDNHGLNSSGNFLLDNGMAVAADTTQAIVGIPERPRLESRLQLSNPYPNPSDDASRFRGYRSAMNINVRKDGLYTMEVYDVAGNRVHSEKIYLKQGTDLVGWNGKNFDGNNVTKGVYFIKIEGQGDKDSKKVVLK